MLRAELHTFANAEINSVAILGGGIASLLVAERLLALHPSLAITLYCKDEALAQGASGNKQGAVYPHLQGSQSPLASLNAASYRFALDYYDNLLRQGLDFQHQWSGVLMQAHTDELIARYTKVSQAWPKLAEFIDAEASSNIANLPLPYPSLWFPEGGWLAPFEFCRALSSRLQANFDFNLHLQTEVHNLSKDNRGWRLGLNQDQMSGLFDALVVCGGHLSSQFEQTRHLPIEPIRGQVSRLHGESSLASLNTVLCHKGYITPSQGEYQCFGATFDRNVSTNQHCPKDDERNLVQLQKVYSDSSWSQALSLVDVVGSKAGIRANSPDHLPIVGPVVSNNWVANNVDKNNGKMRRLDKIKYRDDKGELSYPPSEWQGLYILSGLGARGLTTAPLMAHHLAQLMCGESLTLAPKLQMASSSLRYQVRDLKRNKQGR